VLGDEVFARSVAPIAAHVASDVGRVRRERRPSIWKPSREDAVATNWKKNQPIVHYARTVLVLTFPILVRLGYSKHPSGIGGYVDRTTRSGGPSAHAEGRALDIYLSAFVPAEKRLGDGLFDLFRRNPHALGVDHVIWNRRIWSSDKGGPRPYTNAANGPHTNHVHVAFTREGSQVQPPALQTLAAALRRRLDGEHYAWGRQIEGWEEARRGVTPAEVSPYR
jgi:hypothetical protein